MVSAHTCECTPLTPVINPDATRRADLGQGSCACVCALEVRKLPVYLVTRRGEAMTIEVRLATLERELDRARRNMRGLLTGFALAVGALALGWVSSAVPGAAQDQEYNVIRAEMFILEDADGRVRAELTMSKSGPYLKLFNEKGQPRAMPAGVKGEAVLALANENGETGAKLVIGDVGSGLRLRDEKGWLRAIFDVPETGPFLAMFDEKGQIRAKLDVKETAPTVVLRDETGQRRAVMGAGKATLSDGTTITYPESVRLFGPDGGMTWQAP